MYIVQSRGQHDSLRAFRNRPKIGNKWLVFGGDDVWGNVVKANHCRAYLLESLFHAGQVVLRIELLRTLEKMHLNRAYRYVSAILKSDETLGTD